MVARRLVKPPLSGAVPGIRAKLRSLPGFEEEAPIERTKPERVWDYPRALGDDWQAARHLMTILRAVEDAIAGRGLKRICVSLPPGFGKTGSISRWLPLAFLDRYPNRRVGLVSYGAELAEDSSRWVRDRIDRAHANEDTQGLLNVRVSSRSSSASRWDTTGGGGMVATGVGGPLTGWRLGLLSIDDPYKNREEAESPAHREKVWEWMESVASTRMEPGAVIVVAFARWHHEDLAAKLKAEDEGKGLWRFLEMPARATAHEDWDEWEREVGDPLWPERFDSAALDEIEATLSAYAWLGLYQQAPPKVRERPGALWTMDVIRTGRRPMPPRTEFATVAIGLDPSVSSDPKADETGIIAGGITYDRHVYIFGDFSGHYGAKLWPARTKEVLDALDANYVVFEDNRTTEEEFLQLLKACGVSFPYRKVHARSGKRLRAEPVAALYVPDADGTTWVHHVEGVPLWELESQLCSWRETDKLSPGRLDAAVWLATYLRLQGGPVETNFDFLQSAQV